MYGSLNKMMLIGFVGQEPEIVNFENGGSIAKISVATNENYYDKDNNLVKSTQWHWVVVNGKNVKYVENNIHKGDRIYVEGKLRSRSYDDKDGKKVYVTEIITRDIELIPGKDKNNESEITPE